MWLLVAAGLLQVLLLTERILYRVLFVLVPLFYGHDDRSAVKHYADNSVVASLCATITYVLLTPLNFLVAAVSMLLQNAWLVAFLLVMSGILLIVSENLQRAMLLFVGTYNNGIGQLLDLYFMQLELIEWFVRMFIPLYNSSVWLTTQVIMQVLLPLMSVDDVFASIPELLQNLSLMVSAFSVSLASYTTNVLFCASGADHRGSTSYGFSPSNTTQNVPFTDGDLQCVGNHAYYTLDLMTPGSFMQQAVTNVQGVLLLTCSPVAFLVEFALYPLTDFNLYKAVHCAVNFVLSTVVTLPLMTIKRCAYARHNADYFYDEEVAVMCVPDFAPWTAALLEVLRAGGRLIDNWLDVGLAMVERVRGVNQDLCKRARKPGAVAADASAFFETTEDVLKYVQLTDAMAAVTDGHSTLYYTGTDGTFSEMAVGNWPFRAEPAWGVAAVRAGGTEDADVQADTRTGLFGCQCVDEPVAATGAVSGAAHTRLRVLCAAVPYVGFHDNETNYNASTVHEVVFADEHVRSLMRCDDTLIRVHPLRFSRKRFSDARTPAPLNDLFDTVRAHGNLPPVAHTADAAVYIQPRCGSGPGFGACFDSLDTCFPFCLGLHLAGQSGANISAVNAHRWDESVTFAQLECVGGFADFEADCEGLGATSQVLGNSAFGVREQRVCNLGSCSADASSTTALEVARLAEGGSLAGALRNKTTAEYAGWVRLGEQPFVVAGDVMLRIVEIEGVRRIRVTRLFDHNSGQFTLQHEQLGLLHGDAADVLDHDAECQTVSDAQCYTDAVSRGQIVLPPSYFTSKQLTYVPAAASEWAVHWAVNPDNAVYASRIERCKGNVVDTVVVSSSYGTPRVWTLHTMQAAVFGDASTPPSRAGATFMTIPNWFDVDADFVHSELCHVMFGMRITDLEYIDEQNVLVTVLTTTMQNYDIVTHTGRDPALVRYTRYFLHPTRRDCVDAGDSYERAIFSCFRHESAGPFTSAFVARNNQLLGTFCPAMRRMPQLGSGAAEVLAANVHMAKMALDVFSVLPVAWIDTMYDTSRTQPTFHSVLYGDFLVTDNLVDCLARAGMHFAHALPRLGRFLEGVPGYSELQPRLIGTAKILQHSDNVVPLTGAFLGQLRAVKAIPVRETLQSGYTKLQTVSISRLSESVQRGAAGMAGSIRLNLRLLREAVGKGLMASAKQAGSAAQRGLAKAKARAGANFGRMLQRAQVLARNAAAQGTSSVTKTAKIATASALMSTTLFEAQDDIRRYFLDVVRVQCHGLGEFVGDNQFGKALRHLCLLLPDGVEGALRVLLVLMIDYPLMDCVCRQTREVNRVAVVTDRCLPQLFPIASRTYMINYLRATDGDTCFAYMDEANGRLLDAFGPVLQRMHRAGDALADALDYLLVWVSGYDAGQCRNYDASAYVMALLPEPASYFMGCMRTFDCRARCFDGITAFEQALAALDAPPVFVDEVDVDVDSRFFSDADVEAGRDRLPFPAYGMAELGRASCSTLCHSDAGDRCLALFGLDNGAVEAAYYCVPRSFMESVRRIEPVFVTPYYSEWGEYSKVVNIWALTIDAFPARETLLISVLNTTSEETTLWVYAATGERFVLLETRAFDPEDTESVQADLQQVLNVRVQPRSDWHPSIHVDITGTRDVVSFEKTDEDTEVAVVNSITQCLSFEITPDPLADFGLSVVKTSCAADDVPDTHKIVRVQKAGNTHIDAWIPLASAAGGNVRLVDDGLPEEFTVQQSIGALNVDPAVTLVLTTDDVAVLNRKFLADASESAYTEDGTLVTLNLLLVGALSDTRSWIHNVRIELDRTTQQYTVDVRAAERVRQTISLQAECRIDNCAACQTREPQLRYHDVQMRCYAAAECAVARCVGTLVNMRKPLCNLGTLLVRQQADMARIALGATWTAVAQSTVAIVELTRARRERYEFTSYQEFFTALTCSAKDSIVSTAATFTSIVGLATSAVHGLVADDLSPQSHVLDSNTNGRIVLGLAAFTNFAASVAMVVLYPLITANKVLQCQADSALAIFSNLIGDSAGVRIEVSLTSDGLNRASDSAVGVCLSEFSGDFMRDLSDSSGKHKIASVIANLLTDIGFFTTNTFFSPAWQTMQALFAYLYGVVTGMMDVVQVIDWDHCKLPVTAFARVDRCACGDTQVEIPAARKGASVSAATDPGPTSSLWCSGLMMLTAADGSDFLIWNPYSLQQLLASGDIDAYVACLATVDARNCREPTLPDLDAQGVNLIQVVTRCRTNFQQARWDPASVIYGLLALEVWRNPAFLTEAVLDEVPATDAIARRLLQLRVYMRANSLLLDSETLACLTRANGLALASHDCADGFYRRSAFGSTAAFFQYQHSSSTAFPDRDACEVFSGRVQQPTAGARYSPILWRSSSGNKVPLAKLHSIDIGDRELRMQHAQSELNTIVQESIEFFAVNPFDAQEAGELKIEYSSWEGDSLHQMVDCVILGPYAAADMQSSFRLPSGARLPVAQYHRGSATSRAFPATDETGGSEVRRGLMQRAFEHVQNEYQQNVAPIIQETYQRIKIKFRDVRNMYCICENGDRDLACCDGIAHENAIRFDLESELERTYNIFDELQNVGFAALNREEVFRKDLWADETFTFHVAHEFSEAEREELAREHVFDPSLRVGTYAADEALVNSTEETLWSRCTNLLSTPFFTIPLRTGLTDAFVFADTQYDPTDPPADSRDAFLHGMEHAIAAILERAREQSPVFWTHPHRYMPDRSVWCESDTVTTDPVLTDYFSGDLKGQHFQVDNLEIPSIDRVRYPSTLACACEALANGTCQVPAELCAATPTFALCADGLYTSKDDLYAVLHAMDAANVSCHRGPQPSVVWGLLNRDEHVRWFSGERALNSPSLHDVAVLGPAGVRLGMFKPDDDDALHTHVSNAKLSKSEAHRIHNLRYQHTVGQPFCANMDTESLPSEFQKDDLRQYLKDVLFPVAHSVFVAPVGAECSTWVVEYALWQVLHYIHGESHPDTLEQQAREERSRGRCVVQLQQIGICNLRGVFDIAPADAQETPAHCPFTVSPSHGCSEIFYVTPNCLVMCNSTFYDPCLCAPGACDGHEFTPSTELQDCKVALDPRVFATHPDLLLHSMHWPEDLGADEAANVDGLQELLDVVRERLSNAEYDAQQLHESVAHFVAQHDTVYDEGVLHAPCGDMLDYLEGSEQHPIGYHPTRTCSLRDGTIRGFDAWMSMPSDANGEADGYMVDPVRLRNMTEASRVFGVSHLVCDASAFGALAHGLNPYALETKWNANRRADPSVPLDLTPDDLASMQTTGSSSGRGTDTPCAEVVEPMIAHSVGLVRDWMRLFEGDDKEQTQADQQTYDEQWPHWGDTPCEYGLPTNAPAHPGCAHPPLYECDNDDHCATTAGNALVCLRGDHGGVCAAQGSCFRHEHCIHNDQLCSGEGECVDSRLFIEHSGAAPHDIDVQLFALDETTACNDTMYGTSVRQLVPSFAHDHGLCSARNWHVFRHELASKDRGEYESAHVWRLNSFDLVRPEEAVGSDIFDRHVLRAEPHPCDRDYQMSTRMCTPDAVNSFAGMGETAQASNAPIARVRGLRTWTTDNNARQLRRCRLSEKHFPETTGFLHPYAPPDQSLARVRADIAHCTDFRVCEQFRFLVEGVSVENRRVAVATWNAGTGSVDLKSDVFREFSAADADACWGMGYRVTGTDTASDVCIVDRFAAPLMYVVTGRVGKQAVLADVTLTPTEQNTELERIRAKCPSAFSRPIDGYVGGQLFAHFVAELPKHYFPSDRGNRALLLNQLLPAFFGIDSNGNGRGFDDLDGYLQHSTCARFLSDQLITVQETLRGLNVYVQDSLAPEQVPGHSLYLFHEFAPLTIIPRWFWQCVVLARANEGGAPSDWFARATNPTATALANSLACPLYDDAPGIQDVTVKRLLQQTDELFVLSETADGSVLENPAQPADALVDAVRDGVANALDVLGLTQSPRMHCMRAVLSPGFTEPFDNSTCFKYLAADTCWEKSCEGECDNNGYDPDYNLYSEAMSAVFGETDWTVVRSSSYTDLETAGNVALGIDLEQLVPPNTRFVSFLSLPKLREASQQIDPAASETYGVFDDSEVDAAYAVRDAETCEYRLVTPEFESLENRGNFDEPFFQNVDGLRYLTFDKARFELLRRLYNTIYDHFTNVDTLHVSTDASVFTVDHGTEDQSALLHTAFAFSKGMREKTYPCAESNTFNLQLETNDVPQELRACVDELERDIAWRVPRGATLQLRPGAAALIVGFFPTFSPAVEPGEHFLDHMLDKEWIRRSSVDRAVCFRRDDGTVVPLNPLWAGDYDVTSCPTGSCGCDTYVIDGEGRTVDTRCTVECNSSFPEFYRLLHARMPEQCMTLGFERTPVVLKRGTLLDQYTPLCDLGDDLADFQTGCDAGDAFGTLHGWTGETLSDLYTHTTPPERNEGGLFSASNSIFRRRAFTPTSLPTLALSPSDIGGSALHFALERHVALGDVLMLKCAMLQSSPTEECTPSESRWLTNIEDNWRWQHNRLQEAWPEPSARPTWSCPLQWISAYSGTHKEHVFAARTPARTRNRVRFAFLTGASYYAHPTVQSVSTMSHLRPARFKADHLMCSATRASCSGGSTELTDTIAKLKSRDWTIVQVKSGDDTCTQILDWPHQTFRLRDQTNDNTKTSPECFAIDRLPRFAIRTITVEPPTPTSTESPAMQSGGACHMGRLRRLVRPDASTQAANQHLQMCTDDPELDALQCMFAVKNDDGTFTREHRTVHVAPDPPAPSARRKATDVPWTRYSQCETVRARVLDPHGAEHDLPDNHPTISIGQPVRLSTERMLAAYLRRKMCPNATDAVCAGLRELFAADAWKRGTFLPLLLNTTRYHELFANFSGGRLPSHTHANTSAPSDDLLWARKWVYCDQSQNDNQGCHGSVSRGTWLDPRQRVPACAAAITTHQTQSPKVYFCLLNAQTAKLCEQIAQWNTRIAEALCRAAGLCSESAFFYNPTTYSVDNQQFVSASVLDFYNATDPGAGCDSLSADLVAAQVASNADAKQRCASVSLEVLRFLIDMARNNLQLVFKIVYYVLMAIAQVVQIIVAALSDSTSGSSSLLGDAVTRLGTYIKLLMESIRDFLKYIVDAMWRLLTDQEGSFGQKLRELVEFICNIAAAIKQAMCFVVGKIYDMFEIMQTGFRIFRNFTFNVLGEKIPLGRWMFVIVARHSAFTDYTLLALKPVRDHLCEPMKCDISFDSERRSLDGTLPVATRCWSTFAVAFGERNSLACSAADTCRASRTDDTLVTCAECPASANAFVSTFDCDPLLKLCACEVPRSPQTLCSTNAECIDTLTSPTCALANSGLEIGTGAIECAACTTSPICLLATGAETGVCACPLFKTPFSSCTVQGEIVLPAPDAFCLLQPASHFASSAQYTAAFSTALTAACHTLDPTAVFCARILDATGSNTLYAVGTRTSAVYAVPTRRRLLSFAEIVAASQKEVERMIDMHSDYASQLVTAFDYEYTNLYTDNTALGWVTQWPPNPALAAEAAQTCEPFWNLMRVLAHAAGNASLPVTPTGRRMKGVPGNTLAAAWPRVPRSADDAPHTRSVRAGDAIVGTWVWFLRRALSAVGFSTNSVYDLLTAAFNELLSSVRCDFEAVQTCSRWRVLLIHSAIVNAVFFSVWFLVASGARMSFAASLSVVLFVPSVLYLSYGYSPFCAPMIPTCIFEDLVRSLRLVFPRFMRIPQAFVRDAVFEGQRCVNILETPTLFTTPAATACMRSCDEAPLQFTSWRAVFAWYVAELGQGAVDWVLDMQAHIPFLDHNDMQEQLILKNGIWRFQDDALVTAHRICAAVDSYLLAPYLMLAILAATAVVATILVVLVPALIPFFGTVAQLYAAMFVGDE